MTELLLEHTDAEGTVLYGTSRGDGSAELLKARRWRWGRSLGAWYVPTSRGRPPRRALIADTVADLEQAGFTVTVTVDATPADQAVVEKERAARGEERAERLLARAEQHTAAAAEVGGRADRIRDGIPLGQPVLLGHHSQRRHERDLDRLQRLDDAEVDHLRQARHDEQSAATAAAGGARRHAPVTVANRIERLAAQLRADERDLAETGAGADTQGLRDRISHTAAELQHWRAVRAEQIHDGTATDSGPGTVAAGDQVKIRGSWYVVVRANPTTVTVQTPSGTGRTPWHEVRDHRPAERTVPAGTA